LHEFINGNFKEKIYMNVNNSQLAYFLCGGTGINVGVALKGDSKTDNNKSAFFVGLDSSSANSSHGLFEIEYMVKAGSADEKTQGSGKVKATNYPQAEQFVAQTLAKHKPRPYNVVVCNTAGGTGSMLGFVLARTLLAQGHLVVLCLINDMTSQVEMSNAVGSLRSFANQTGPNFLDTVIPYLEFNNTLENTRGEVNSNIVDKLNILSLFLTGENGEMDYQDVKNLLSYSKHYGVPAALSRIRFFDADAVAQFTGKVPVAVASLFKDSNSVIPRFNGTVIRSTGVFAKDVARPKNTDELHMVLDHGEALQELEQKMKELDDRKVASSSNFVQQKDLSAGADASGFVP
jgi:hypothetical protein